MLYLKYIDKDGILCMIYCHFIEFIDNHHVVITKKGSASVINLNDIYVVCIGIDNYTK